MPFSWSETPWDPEVPGAGRALGLGHAVWDLEERGPPPWIAGAFTDDRGAAEVTHIRHHPAEELYRDLAFEPAGPVPPRPRRGTATDVGLTILFGAVPVFAAPESWLAWFLQRRARDRATTRRIGWATRIWFAWPIVVGIDWLITMDGLGRWGGPLAVRDRAPGAAPVRARRWPIREGAFREEAQEALTFVRASLTRAPTSGPRRWRGAVGPRRRSGTRPTGRRARGR